MEKITWYTLTKIQPALEELYYEALNQKTRKGYCKNAVWYKKLKPKLIKLVGWESSNTLYSSETAYEIAYYKIYTALPDCNHNTYGIGFGCT